MDPYEALLDAARLRMDVVCFLDVPDDPDFDRHPLILTTISTD